MGKIKYRVGHKFEQPYGNTLTLEKLSCVKGKALFSCNMCSSDKELFPTGLFVSRIGGVVRGNNPCLCSNINKLTPSQNKILINRELLSSKSSIRVVEYINAKKLVCECSVCSKDIELWPYGSIITTKEQVLSGSKSCGCSFNPKWKRWKYVIRIKRKCLELNLEFLGVVDKKGDINKDSKIKLFNKVTGNTWETTPVGHFIREGSIGDPDLVQHNLSEEECINNINNYLNYRIKEFISFDGKFAGNKSILNWLCDKGHKNRSHYSTLIKGEGCKTCYRNLNPTNGKGFYPKRANENDTFYILLIDGSYLKVGRSFSVKRRIKELKNKSKTKDIKVLYEFKGKHIDVYSHEQDIIKSLRRLKLIFISGWSFETCKLEGLDHIVSSTNLNEKLVTLQSI